MATTVHIPKDILDAVDDRARTLKLNRNRFILQALKKALSEDFAWPQEFLRSLDNVDPAEAKLVDSMLDDILRHRSSRKKIAL